MSPKVCAGRSQGSLCEVSRFIFDSPQAVHSVQRGAVFSLREIALNFDLGKPLTVFVYMGTRFH